jgi:hypothetical protein
MIYRIGLLEPSFAHSRGFVFHVVSALAGRYLKGCLRAAHLTSSGTNVLLAGRYRRLVDNTRTHNGASFDTPPAHPTVNAAACAATALGAGGIVAAHVVASPGGWGGRGVI